jgi:hypothetical protein
VEGIVTPVTQQHPLGVLRTLAYHALEVLLLLQLLLVLVLVLMLLRFLPLLVLVLLLLALLAGSRPVTLVACLL